MVYGLVGSRRGVILWQRLGLGRSGWCFSIASSGLKFALIAQPYSPVRGLAPLLVTLGRVQDFETISPTCSAPTLTSSRKVWVPSRLDAY